MKLKPLWLWELLRRVTALRRVGAWTALMTAAVVLTSFSPEVAFVWALSRPHPRCPPARVAVPLDPHPACFPARALARSPADVFVPPLFAALVVAASACLLKALALAL